MTDLELIKELSDAILWMTGSADFSPEGQGHKHFKASVEPLMHEGMDRTKELREKEGVR